MPAEPLQIQDTTTNDERILRLSGPLTLSNLFEFQSLARADRSRSLIVDLTNVPYIDSAGIGSLVGAYVSRQKERSLTLVGVSTRVRDALRITKVEQFFRIVDTLDQAIQAKSSQATG
jgi:anti-sigma B factor antagonist